MTDNDKTRQKLVDSIRKTKAGASAKDETNAGAATPPNSVSPSPASPNPAPANPGARSTQRRAKTTGQQGTSRPRTKPAAPLPISAEEKGDDPYQSGRRVWPD